MVETAVVIGLFMLFLFSIFEYGRLVMLENLIINAAREGCRYAVVHSTGPSLAYAITGPDGATVGLSGDTTLCAGLRRTVAASQLMVCECTGWDAPVGTHMWAGEVRTLVEDYPETTILLTHLVERRTLPGALLAHDLLTLEVSAEG